MPVPMTVPSAGTDHQGRAELLTGIEGASSRPVRKIALLGVVALAAGTPSGRRSRAVKRHSGGGSQ